MDQRVSDERRNEAAPNREATQARGGAPDARAPGKQSWLDRLRKRRRLVLTVTAACIAVGVGVVAWWVNTSGYESTDDAFIDARTVTISSQISAQVVDVPVTDNQLVKAGTVLVTLERSDFQAQVDQGKAQADQALANIANIDAQIGAQQARIDQANKQVAQSKAALTFAQQQDQRYGDLVKSGAVTVEQAQQYKSNFLQAQASFDAAQANAVATEKQLPVLQSQKLQAQAQLEQMRATLDQAQINLSRTNITAPVDGYVTNLTATKGNYAAPGQALMMFVPREVWVTANFKETQIGSIRPGAAVTITVDAYPNRTFDGHVASIQAGSGTAFSLLPPQNATGNYVKIVQRVPVKIVFNQPPDVLLGPGMSVVPTVRLR
ncbi:MAG TPA: HlyD family secretion protein [Xanthobacteraceae bacterium]|nr:HlyD family secretion protein [Xanthobacteraceae bacterium]